jgi:hypothetical protein
VCTLLREAPYKAPQSLINRLNPIMDCGVVVLKYPITSRLDSIFPNYPNSDVRRVIAMLKEHRIVNRCHLVFNEFNTDLACR